MSLCDPQASERLSSGDRKAGKVAATEKEAGKGEESTKTRTPKQLCLGAL